MTPSRRNLIAAAATLASPVAHAITPSVDSRLPFEPSKNRKGVTMLACSPHMLVVHPSVPANNLQVLKNGMLANVPTSAEQGGIKLD